MTKFQNKLYQVCLFLGDSAIFFGSLLIAFAIRRNDFHLSFEDIGQLFYAFVPLWVFLITAYFVGTLYEVSSIMTSLQRVKMIVRLNGLVFFFGLAMFYGFSDLFGVTPKVILLLQSFVFTVLVVFWRVLISHHVRTKKKRKALLVGDGAIFSELRHAVNENPHSPFVFAEHIEIHSPLLGDTTLESLKTVLRENEITILVIDVKNEKVTPLLPYFYNLVGGGIRIYDVNKMYEDVFRRTPLSSVGYFWFFEHVDLEKKLYSILKRGLDLLLALPVGAVFVCSLPIIYILQKIENDGEGLFSIQKRWGEGGKIINVYKYRTMLYTDEGRWRIEKGNQNRATKLGKILNKTNIDELPQVINILKGEMSFIGPRNDIAALGERLAKEIPFYMIRYSVRPGISGWAQTLQKVDGQNPQTVEQNIIRLQYDLFYIKNRSLLLDLVIVLRTIKTLLTRLVSTF